MRARAKGSAPVWDDPDLQAIYQQWRDWARGIPPGREWLPRGRQNPRLLLAFAALDAAQDSVSHKEKTPA